MAHRPTGSRLTLAALAVATALSCGVPRRHNPDGGGGEFERRDLANVSYVLPDLDEVVTLTDGEWEGAPYVAGSAERPRVILLPGPVISTDLDGDATPEGTGLLNLSPGGTGQLLYVVVVAREGTEVIQRALAFVGDRVQVRAFRSEDKGRAIVLDLVQAGAEDAACCPGDLVSRTWRLASGETLAELPMAREGRLSLDALGEEEWVLRRWGWSDPAPSAPTVTLSMRDGTVLVGNSGCNRYSAPTVAGPGPGDLSVVAAAVTRMACPEADAAVETRFLRLLSAVRKFGFQAGDLFLSYDTGDERGAMFLSQRPAASEPSAGVTR